MQIYLKKDAFLRQLFPGLEEAGWQDDARLSQHLRNAYSRGGYTPEVSVEGNVIRIQVDEAEAANTHDAYERAVQLAQRGQYAEAKAIIEPLLEKGSQNAELYRIYGQMLAEEGETEQAIDHLIEALRWNPQHTDALLMMGNLYAEQQDMPTAQLFYGRVMEADPDNYLALNNIGGVLAKKGQLEAAIPFFERSLQAKADFPNALYGLALAEYRLGDNQESFERCRLTLNGVKMGGGRGQFPQLFRQLLEQSARAYAETVEASALYGPLRQEEEYALAQQLYEKGLS